MHEDPTIGESPSLAVLVKKLQDLQNSKAEIEKEIAKVKEDLQPLLEAQGDGRHDFANGVKITVFHQRFVKVLNKDTVLDILTMKGVRDEVLTFNSARVGPLLKRRPDLAEELGKEVEVEERAMLRYRS